MNRHDRIGLATARAPIMPADVRTVCDRLLPQRPPEPGEYVLTCGHARRWALLVTPDDAANPTQWFELFNPATGEPGAEIVTPKGTIKSRWLAVCQACMKRAGGYVDRVEIRDHFCYSPSPSGD